MRLAIANSLLILSVARGYRYALVRMRVGLRTQRKERNEMTSLFARPITAASDNGVCRWHAAKLWQTHAIKYEITEIEFDSHHKLHNK